MKNKQLAGFIISKVLVSLISYSAFIINKNISQFGIYTQMINFADVY